MDIYTTITRTRQSAWYEEVLSYPCCVPLWAVLRRAFEPGAGGNDVTSTIAEVFPTSFMAWCSGESPDDCPHGFPVRRESCMARMVCKHGGMGRLKMDGPRMPSGKVTPIGHHQRQQISTIQLFESWASLTIRLVARSGPTSAKTVSGRSFYPPSPA